MLFSLFLFSREQGTVRQLLNNCITLLDDDRFPEVTEISFYLQCFLFLIRRTLSIWFLHFVVFRSSPLQVTCCPNCIHRITYTLCQPLAALTKNTGAKKGAKTTTAKRILLPIYQRTVKDRIQRLLSRYKVSALLEWFFLVRPVN